MSENPFDEFRKIEQMFRRALEGMDTSLEGSSYSVSIKRIGDETKVNVSGDVSKDDIKMLKRKYPDADIEVDGGVKKESGPVEVVDEDSRDFGEEREQDQAGPDIEVLDDEEAEASELALKRFREKKKEDDSED